MFKMRMNFKRLTIISAIMLFLWLLFSVSSLIEVPKSNSSGKKVVNIQNRIFDLEKQMDKQLTESGKLLNIVKEKLRKMTPAPAKNSLDSAPWSGNESENLRNGKGPVLPVLVIACDRVTVKRCLENLIDYRPNKETFPIIVSQDCGHNETYKVINNYVDDDASVFVVRQPDLSEIPLTKAMIKFRGYYKIARHYRFALNYVLKTLLHDAVIIVEDDLDISPDFFNYFLGTYPLLRKDPSIWCISAWNDNGKKGLIDQSQPQLLHRTDFFPGLGWMLTADTWKKLETHWPDAFFDDWLRNPKNTQGRACIRPEISRTYSFGKVGVSKGLFFDMHLRYIQLNVLPVEFTKLDLFYLLKDNYDTKLEKTISSIPTMSAEEILALRPSDEGLRAVKVLYNNAKSYQKAAKKLGLMDDFRSGVPRTAYKGIVTCYIKERRVYLVPNYKWTEYDPTWG